MTDDILDKADSLMRRHRAFVAGEPPVAAVPPAPTFSPAAETDVVAEPAAETITEVPEAEDIPVLTEVVTESEEIVQPAAITSDDIEAMLRSRLTTALPHQREILRRELALWLDEQLPPLLMRVLDGVTDQLVAQINTQARMTLLPRLHAALEVDTEAPPPAD
ncbi:MAG: hypothetical protein KJ787_12190 [Gammaproteobacteria bacterium]|nr:hypothetical protein [Gammaproteobacteria bacterium]MBU1647083.1 hypothetical protein [Gammaproteobacteria bacterium]MBU1972595.1 hypothetical protein [Gammaproteobacteria bacterium]